MSQQWMLYPVRSEQIEAAGSDDHDHAEWVIRADGPLPGHPVEVVPAAERDEAVDRLREVIRDFVEHPDPWTLARARKALGSTSGECT